MASQESCWGTPGDAAVILHGLVGSVLARVGDVIDTGGLLHLRTSRLRGSSGVVLWMGAGCSRW